MDRPFDASVTATEHPTPTPSCLPHPGMCSRGTHFSANRGGPARLAGPPALDSSRQAVLPRSLMRLAFYGTPDNLRSGSRPRVGRVVPPHHAVRVGRVDDVELRRLGVGVVRQIRYGVA